MSNEVEKNEVGTGEAHENSGAANGPAESTKKKKPKKKGKALVIVLVVVIVVVLLFGGAGVVYATQHSNPQFCNLVCHTPMDPYVESYVDGTSVSAQQADLDTPLSVTIHKESDQDIACVTCHTDGLGTQISEGMSWITGNYTVPLEDLVLTVKDTTNAHERSGITMCLTAGCHEGISSLEELKKSTAHLDRNPHDSHNGDQNCTNCHQIHSQSVMMCTQCHADAEVPDGWLTYTEQQKQIKEASASAS